MRILGVVAIAAGLLACAGLFGPKWAVGDCIVRLEEHHADSWLDVKPNRVHVIKKLGEESYKTKVYFHYGISSIDSHLEYDWQDLFTMLPCAAAFRMIGRELPKEAAP